MNRFPRWMFSARAGAESDDGFAAGVGAVYVFISHDLSVVEHIADEVMVCTWAAAWRRERKTKSSITRASVHSGATFRDAAPEPGRSPQRIKLSGELPSPLNPPPGCASTPAVVGASAPAPSCSRS